MFKNNFPAGYDPNVNEGLDTVRKALEYHLHIKFNLLSAIAFICSVWDLHDKLQ